MHFIKKNLWIIPAVLIILIIIIALIVRKNKGDDKGKYIKVSKSGTCFDTALTITIYGYNEHKMKDVLERAFKECESMEERYSSKLKSSEISKINREAGRFKKPGDDILDMIKISYEWSEKTEGAFDITLGNLINLWDIPNLQVVPKDEDIRLALEKSGYHNLSIKDDKVELNNGIIIDLGGVAKGYACEKLKEFILSEGSYDGVINFGGNVTVFGDKGGKPFVIGIKNPRGDGIIQKLNCKDISVVTSGDYERYKIIGNERYHHILDIRTGAPAKSGLISASIVGPDSTICDILSTAVFVMGKDKGLALVEGLEGYEAMVIDNNGSEYETKGFSSYK